MKITTTQTQEITIELPSFTKVSNGSSINAYFCIQDENNIISLKKYGYSQAVNISKSASKYEAFAEGYQFITKQEFFENYNDAVDALYDDMKELQDSLDDDNRTDFEKEQDRKEAFEEDRANEYCDNRD